MDKKIFIENNSHNKQIANDFYSHNRIEDTVLTSDNMLNDFLNKNVSLESIIESEMVS